MRDFNLGSDQGITMDATNPTASGPSVNSMIGQATNASNAAINAVTQWLAIGKKPVTPPVTPNRGSDNTMKYVLIAAAVIGGGMLIMAMSKKGK